MEKSEITPEQVRLNQEYFWSVVAPQMPGVIIAQQTPPPPTTKGEDISQLWSPVPSRKN